MDDTRGKLNRVVSLAAHTSWKVGGVAKRCYLPSDLQDLQHFLVTCPKTEPLLWLGLGSNTLIRERGFEGTVILTKGSGLQNIQSLDARRLRVEAGVPCPVLARVCAKQGYTGLEFLAGIPGTIGGALAMNAGAHGGEIWDWVTQVEIVNREGEHLKRLRSDYKVGYRSVSTDPDEWFVAAEFLLKADRLKQGWDRIRSVIAHRKATQPTQPSAGSVFRNPIRCHAGQLIEQAGLKGVRIGGASISEKHANFIINRNKASSEDIEQLIETVQSTVMERYGIFLEQEIRVYPHKDIRYMDT